MCLRTFLTAHVKSCELVHCILGIHAVKPVFVATPDAQVRVNPVKLLALPKISKIGAKGFSQSSPEGGALNENETVLWFGVLFEAGIPQA